MRIPDAQTLRRLGWRRAVNGRPLAIDRETVLESLRTEGPADSAGLAERLGISKTTAWRRLDELRTDGLVENIDGVWRCVA